MSYITSKAGITLDGGFKLDSAQPLDVRFVVASGENKDELLASSCYAGMEVWDSNDSKKYRAIPKTGGGFEWKEIGTIDDIPEVDLSDYVVGPASATDNAIARFDTATGKLIQNSSISIDDNGNVVPATSVASDLGSSGNIWKNAHIKAIHLRVGGQDTGTSNANAYGLGFWKPSFYTWYEYMAPNTSNSPTGAKAPQYGEVTTYARRSLIENTSGYGWVWEACANSKNATPVGKMALSSNTGNLTVAGSVTASGFKHSDATTGTNDYVLLAGGSTKPISDFTTGGGSIGDYVTKSTNQTITGIKTFSHSTFGAIILKRDGSTNASSVIFQNNNGTLGSIGMTGAANGGLQRWTANTNTVYTIWDSGNDGSGSGLDADKLDGQEGSYYLDYNNFTNKPTIPNPANYYWANVAISSTSSTATTPSVQKIGITGSTTIDATAAVTMEYDSGYKALKFVFA